MDPQPEVRAHGEVFTRKWVTANILDLCGYTEDRDLGAMTLVEPSVGSGAFLIPVAERLIASSLRCGRDLDSLGDAVKGYDIQQRNIEHCHQKLVTLGLPESVVDKWLNVRDFLLADDRPRADFVVGNPPYIRIEELDPGVVGEYRRRWPTMGGRADIYVGFYERSLGLLRPQGVLGFICADRWMRNQYGAGLRALIGHAYAMEYVWNMHDVDAFEEQVSAYPAITIIRRSPQGSVCVAETTSKFGENEARDLAQWCRSGQSPDSHDATGFSAHRLQTWFPAREPWPTGSPARLALVERLNAQFAPLHDEFTGTKVSIGVATGNDAVYVTADPSVAEPDRILPLSMSADLKSGHFEWGGRYLVNPWASNGSLVDLATFPKLREHLENSGNDLRARHVAKKNPQTWHRTIDKVTASLTPRPKLLLQDMRTTINPVLEGGGHYPHHNLYYVVSDSWDLEVLGGLLLSRIAQAFIEAYCVRMRGGTLRFQAQYLKRIRVPDPDMLPDDLAEQLRIAFRQRDTEAATQAAAVAYGIDNLAEFELLAPASLEEA